VEWLMDSVMDKIHLLLPDPIFSCCRVGWSEAV
jgi:hypothetical protein